MNLAEDVASRPAHPLLIGVTGTNGKTSATTMAAQALRSVGVAAASVGQYVETPSGRRPRSDVGRGSDAIRRYGARLAREEGVTVVAVEVYSAAIAAGLHPPGTYAVAAFTNLTPDHLSVHGSFSAYAASKTRFLCSLARHTPLVVDTTAPGARHALRAARHAHLEIVPVDSWDVPFQVSFMAANARMALTLARITGASSSALQAAAYTLKAPPGRFERWRLPGGALAVVDFAHNEGGLQALLDAVRTETSGRVLLLLSSKGGWGAEKRAGLARSAAAGADVVVVTDDDPRREDPALIRAHLRGQSPWREIVPRSRAVAALCQSACPDDTVVLAGRGADTWYAGPRARTRYSDPAALARLGAVPIKPALSITHG